MPRLTREESRQQTRQSLLDAAARTFAERGFHGTSVDQIAEAAGFTKGAVYANFGSKDELFLTLLDRHTEQELQALTPSEGQALDITALIQAQEAGLLDASEEERRWSLLTLEFYLYAMRVPAVREKVAERYRTLREKLAALFEAHFAASGQTPRLMPEALAWVMLGLASGLSLQADLEPERVPRQLLRQVTEVLLDAREASSKG